MRVGTKLATYGLVLATVFGVGAAVGAALGPQPSDDEPVPADSVPTVEHDVHGG